MLRVKKIFNPPPPPLEKNCARIENNGADVVIMYKDGNGMLSKNMIANDKVTNYRPFMRENDEDISLFDRLNMDFDMRPNDIHNPFTIASQFPEYHEETPLVMPYDLTPAQRVGVQRPPIPRNHKKHTKRQHTGIRKTHRVYKPRGNKPTQLESI